MADKDYLAYGNDAADAGRYVDTPVDTSSHVVAAAGTILGGLSMTAAQAKKVLLALLDEYAPAAVEIAQKALDRVAFGLAAHATFENAVMEGLQALDAAAKLGQSDLFVPLASTLEIAVAFQKKGGRFIAGSDGYPDVTLLHMVERVAEIGELKKSTQETMGVAKLAQYMRALSSRGVTAKLSTNATFGLPMVFQVNPFTFRFKGGGLFLWDLNLAEERVREIVRKVVPDVQDIEAILWALALLLFMAALLGAPVPVPIG